MSKKLSFTHLISGAAGETPVRLMAVMAGDHDSRFSYGRGEGIDPNDPQHAERMERLREAVQAKTVRKIEFEAAVSGTGPCTNHFQWAEEDFERFAASFKGKPFMRDHLWKDSTARGGTVRDSWTEDDGAGGKLMRQRIEITKQWAMEEFVDGTMDRFSAGAGEPEKLTCSICGEDPRESGKPSLFGMGFCHTPGEPYDEKGKPSSRRAKGARIAALMLSGQPGKETSWCSVPAMEGTGISAVRFTASGAEVIPYEELFDNGGKRVHSLPVDSEQKRTASAGGPGMDWLKKLLGLADDADDAALMAATETRLTLFGKMVMAAGMDPAKINEQELLAKIMGRTTSGDELAELGRLRGENLELKCSAAVDGAIAAGKYTKAQRDEAMARAKVDLAAFKMHVDLMPVIVPMGEQPPAGNPEDRAQAVNATDAEEFGFKFTAADKPLTDLERKYIRQIQPSKRTEQWLGIYLKMRRPEQRG